MERLTDEELAYNGTVIYKKCEHTNCEDSCSRCHIPKEAIRKLKEYEDLEEQGLLLRLPCKIGDTAYYLHGVYQEYAHKWVDVIDEVEVDSFGLNINLFVNVTYRIGVEKIGRTLTPYKTLFFTKEEAEEALEKMKGESRNL